MKRFIVPFIIALIMISMILVSCGKTDKTPSTSPEQEKGEVSDKVENENEKGESVSQNGASTTTKKGGSAVYYPTYSSKTQEETSSVTTTTKQEPETFPENPEEQFTYEDPEEGYDSPETEEYPEEEDGSTNPDRPTITTSKRPSYSTGGTITGPSIDKDWNIPNITLPPIQIPSIPEIPNLPGVKG